MTRSVDLDEMVGSELGTRLLGELGAAVHRRPVREAGLAGALRVLVGHSERLREGGAAALDVFVRRNTTARPLYLALLRSLVEANDVRVTTPLVRALMLNDAGGLGTIAAAGLSDDGALSEPLAHLAGSRSPHIAFAAELARIARGDSDGMLLATLAPRINESHRIDLAKQLLLPLVRNRRKVAGASQALDILRDSERHLGRWLCIAELSQLSGQETALVEAQRLATDGPSTARAAWSLVAWALAPSKECATRPNLELISRLSDRPSAEREMSFLFRISRARQGTARSMLEHLAKPLGLETDVAIRAAAHLVRDFGQSDLVRRLFEVASSPKRESVRGLAFASLADCHRASVLELSCDLGKSRNHATAAFAALTKIALARDDGAPIVSEENYRRLQLGWSD